MKKITSFITHIFRWVWKTIRSVIRLFHRNKRRPIEPTVIYNMITEAAKTAPVVKVDEFFREPAPAVELEEDDHNAIVITD